MKKTLIVCAALALLAGCDPEADLPLKQKQRDQDASATPATLRDNHRVEVTRIGVFRDSLAYGEKRGVYVIVDKETGKEFIGISGIGISETGSRKSSASDER